MAKQEGKPGSAAAAPAASGKARTLTPEQVRQIAEGAEKRAATFGRILALMSISPRHSKLTLREINEMLTPAITLGQFAMVGSQQQEEGPSTLAAVAWWALVSPEVDKRLSESRHQFLQVENSEWQCGDQPWIIEAVGDKRIVGELLKKLSERTFKDKPAKLRAMLPDGRIAVGRLEPKSQVS